MRVFLICPVRNVTPEETDQITAYVADLEADGVEVYWPARDTDQTDTVGLDICRDNIRAIERAHAVHVWYSASSTGGLFDLGAAMALHKPIRLVNRIDTESQRTEGKSFVNVLLKIDRMGGSY